MNTVRRRSCSMCSPAGDSAMVRNGRHSVEGISDEPCRILAVIVNDIQ